MKRLDATTSRAGFTLTELIVAVAIAGILVLAIAQVFSSVSSAVDSGTSAGNVLHKARTIGDQIRRDAEQMVGPREGGVLVIVNHVTADMAILPDDIDAGISRPVRSDQIMFIRRRGELQPLTPQDQNTLSNASDANYVKLWLGHALEADTDGSAPSPDELSEPALDWIFGRQALFLDNTPTTATAEAAFFDADVETLGSSIGAPTLRHGLSDVAHYGLNEETDVDDPATSGVDERHGAITGLRPSDSGGSGAAHDGAPLYHDRRLWTTLEPDEYATRAYDYTYAVERLLARPVPVGADYAAWKIAQIHPVLGRRVGDIVVEFAGDYDDTAGIDRDGGAIRWYGLNDMPPPTSDPDTNPGEFVEVTTSTVRPNPIVDNGPSAPLASRAFVFRHGPGATNWPHLIRIRYRIYDDDGQVRGTDNRPGVWFEQVLHVNRDG